MNSMVSAAAVVLLASWTGNVMAGSHPSAISSGTVHFQGSIVESPCQPHLDNGQIAIACERHGQTDVRRLLMNSAALQALPQQRGYSHVRWLDAHHTLAVVTLEYL